MSRGSALYGLMATNGAIVQETVERVRMNMGEAIREADKASIWDCLECVPNAARIAEKVDPGCELNWKQVGKKLGYKLVRVRAFQYRSRHD